MTSRFTSSKGSWVPGFIALGIVWGSSFLFIKWALLSLTSIGVAFLRGLIGGLTLLLFALATRTRLPNKLIHWFHLAVVALFLNAIPSYLFAVGETHVTSVMAGLLNATTPLMTVIVITFGEQKINRDQGIGVLIGFIGIAILTGAISGLHGSDLKGIAALLLATFCYGISMPYSKRFVAPLPYSSTALAAGQVIASATLLAPFAMLGGLTHAPWNGKSITGMLALGAVGIRLYLELPKCQIGRKCGRKHCHLHNSCRGNSAWDLAPQRALQDLTALRWSARAPLSSACSEEDFALQKVFLKLPQKACLRFQG